MFDYTKKWILLAALLFPSLAAAHSAGITSASGQNGNTCNGCHGGGAMPVVTITGPMMLDAGKMGIYTLTITGGAAVVGGLDVSSDNRGVQFVAGTDTRVAQGELTHTAAKRFTNGAVAFDFTVVAPQAAGVINLFGAGNSTNGNGGTTGDMAGTTKFTIQVVGGMMGTPDMANPPDMAMAPTADMANPPDMAMAAADMAVAPAPDMSMQMMQGGCSTSGQAGSGLATLLALTPLALLLRRRRK